jgi:hypothetical protein
MREKGCKSGVNCYSVNGAKLILCKQEVCGGTKLVVYTERDLRGRSIKQYNNHIWHAQKDY